MAECRGLAPLARGHALVSTEARLARPVDIPDWSAWGDLHSQGCSGLSRTGLLFPANDTFGRRSETQRRRLVGDAGFRPCSQFFGGDIAMRSGPTQMRALAPPRSFAGMALIISCLILAG